MVVSWFIDLALFSPFSAYIFLLCFFCFSTFSPCGKDTFDLLAEDSFYSRVLPVLVMGGKGDHHGVLTLGREARYLSVCLFACFAVPLSPSPFLDLPTTTDKLLSFLVLLGTIFPYTFAQREAMQGWRIISVLVGWLFGWLAWVIDRQIYLSQVFFSPPILGFMIEIPNHTPVFDCSLPAQAYVSCSFA